MLKPCSKWVGVVLVIAILLAGQPAKIVKAYDEITSNENWSGTVTLDQDVVIGAGVTVNIAPGTTVAIECTDVGNYANGDDYYDDRIEIIVLEGGTLQADGATFRAVDSTTESCWYGIEYDDNSSGYIRNSTIQNGATGISLKSTIEVSGNIIDQMVGRDGAASAEYDGEAGMGIYVYFGVSTEMITDNIIKNIHGGDGWDSDTTRYGGRGGHAYGIYFLGSSVEIADNTIQQIYGGNGGSGANGTDGEAGDPGASPGDPGSDGLNGTAGSDGGYGGEGFGIRVGEYVNSAVIVGNTISMVQSGQGGSGGAGGNGGDGGDGAAGFSIDLPQQGGTGGSGGDGASGGNGGDAFGAYGIHSETSSLQLERNSVSEIRSGSGGRAGTGGNGGSGGNGGDGSYSTEGDGGDGGMGGSAGSGGNAGRSGKGGDSTGINIAGVTLTSFTRNIVSECYAGSDDIPSPGGNGGVGGKGGDGGMGLEVDGTGGNGGLGGNGGNGSGGGTGGFAYGVFLSSVSSESAAVTDNIVTDVYSLAMYGGGSGGEGGNGGNGGLNSGAAGNGGNGGDGGNGGNANGAALAYLYYAEVYFINNTFHYPEAPTNGGGGGAAGTAGDAGTGDISGDPGSPGTTGSSGSFDNAVGMMSYRGEDSFDVYVYNCIFDTIPASNTIGIQEANNNAVIHFDYNDLWNWNLDYSLVTGGGQGSNNIGFDPQFEDTEAYDFHLKEGSLCIDAGDNAAQGVPSVDYDGLSRIVDGNEDDVSVVDLGAFEFRQTIPSYFPIFMHD